MCPNVDVFRSVRGWGRNWRKKLKEAFFNVTKEKYQYMFLMKLCNFTEYSSAWKELSEITPQTSCLLDIFNIHLAIVKAQVEVS